MSTSGEDRDVIPIRSRIIPGLLPWQICLVAYVLGILAFKNFWPAIAVTATVCFLDWRLGLRRPPFVGVALGFLIGLGYVHLVAPASIPETPDWMLQRQKVVVTGVVDEVVTRPGRVQRMLLRDARCKLEDGRLDVLPGRLLWTWYRPDVRPIVGQTVQVTARIKPVRWFGNPGSSGYDWFWHRQSVFFRTWSWGPDAKVKQGVVPDTLATNIRSGLQSCIMDAVQDSPGRDILISLLMGDRFYLSEKVSDRFRDAGLSHVLALSGLHVGFVAMFGWGFAWIAGFIRPRIFLRIPRPKLAVLLACPFVLGYMWLGQFSPSLVRAGCMFGFFGLLLWMNRGRVLLDGLFLAVALILLVSPLSAYDLRLQLSVCAVGGIAILSSPLIRMFSGKGVWWAKFLCRAGGILAVSLCANLALLPLTTWYFGVLAPNLFLNLVWLPVLGVAVMPLGMIGMLLVAVPVVDVVGGFFLSLVAWVLDQLIELVHLVVDAGLTPTYQLLRPLWPEMLGLVVLFVCLAAQVGRRRAPCWSAVGLGVVMLFLPSFMRLGEDAGGKVRLAVIDVGQGQSVLITAPGGNRWLIDGGGSSTGFDIGMAVGAPCLTYDSSPHLDGMIMTHPDSDHSRGLEYILRTFDVEKFYHNGDWPKGRFGKRLRKLLEAGGASETVSYSGQVIELGPNLSLEVLHPGRDSLHKGTNEAALAFRLVWQGRGLAFLASDIEGAGLKEMMAGKHDLKSQVMVIPHHGSKNSYYPELYDSVDFDYAICSCGFINHFGFPDESIVREMEERRIPMNTTAEKGMIEIVWDHPDALGNTKFHGHSEK